MRFLSGFFRSILPLGIANQDFIASSTIYLLQIVFDYLHYFYAERQQL